MAIFIGTGGESRDLPLDVTAALGSMRAAPMECVRVCPNCHLYVNRTYSDSHRRTRASRELLAPLGASCTSEARVLGERERVLVPAGANGHRRITRCGMRRHPQDAQRGAVKVLRWGDSD